MFMLDSFTFNIEINKELLATFLIDHILKFVTLYNVPYWDLSKILSGGVTAGLNARILRRFLL